jgi:hypothetical protein
VSRSFRFGDDRNMITFHSTMNIIWPGVDVIIY